MSINHALCYSNKKNLPSTIHYKFYVCSVKNQVIGLNEDFTIIMCSQNVGNDLKNLLNMMDICDLFTRICAHKRLRFLMKSCDVKFFKQMSKFHGPMSFSPSMFEDSIKKLSIYNKSDILKEA